MKGKTRGKSATTHEPTEGEEVSPLRTGSSLIPRRILVPSDFSECSLRALQYAQELAKALEAKLILLHVAEPAIHAGSLLQVSAAAEDVTQNMLDKSRERLRAIGHDRIAHCATDQILVRLGHAHSEITDTAKALAVDLIVLGAHGSTQLKHETLGSTAERVARRAVCPVLIVREQAVVASEKR